MSAVASYYLALETSGGLPIPLRTQPESNSMLCAHNVALFKDFLFNAKPLAYHNGNIVPPSLSIWALLSKRMRSFEPCSMAVLSKDAKKAQSDEESKHTWLFPRKALEMTMETKTPMPTTMRITGLCGIIYQPERENLKILRHDSKFHGLWNHGIAVVRHDKFVLPLCVEDVGSVANKYNIVFPIISYM